MRARADHHHRSLSCCGSVAKISDGEEVAGIARAREAERAIAPAGNFGNVSGLVLVLNKDNIEGTSEIWRRRNFAHAQSSSSASKSF
jgi:hypothetical protein